MFEAKKNVHNSQEWALFFPFFWWISETSIKQCVVDLICLPLPFNLYACYTHLHFPHAFVHSLGLQLLFALTPFDSFSSTLFYVFILGKCGKIEIIQMKFIGWINSLCGVGWTEPTKNGLVECSWKCFQWIIKYCMYVYVSIVWVFHWTRFIIYAFWVNWKHFQKVKWELVVLSDDICWFWRCEMKYFELYSIFFIWRDSSHGNTKHLSFSYENNCACTGDWTGPGADTWGIDLHLFLDLTTFYRNLSETNF